ncbi:hypothetical protein V2T44_19660 [Serratia ficaria]|nr:hypothetical protein [Serratia sp. 1D1416]MEE4485158.1 hypothetical protein [Serratia ficaria]
MLRRELKEKTMANRRSRMKAFRERPQEKPACDFTTVEVKRARLLLNE